jgi:alkanesulfonate monooxygenase SsuD/methylene tetrahydromethanopterin reductase-like flavin-dependent oxidoreductase (luciferase family)
MWKFQRLDKANKSDIIELRVAGVGLAAVAVFLAGLAAGLAADDARPRHLIYLHGRIVQGQQSARPRHPQFGYYELEKILEAFRERGFVVSREIRLNSASVSGSADRVVEQIRRLLESGVPADRVTVVGASMGAAYRVGGFPLRR